MTTYRNYEKFRTAVLNWVDGEMCNLSMRLMMDDGTVYNSIEEMRDAYLATGGEVLEELLANWDFLGENNFYLVERDSRGELYISKIVDYDNEYGEVTFTLDKNTTKRINNALIKNMVAYLS